MRENQNYYISRLGPRWKVIDIKTKRFVAYYPEYYKNPDIVDKICAAQNAEEVHFILESIDKNELEAAKLLYAAGMIN